MLARNNHDINIKQQKAILQIPKITSKSCDSTTDVSFETTELRERAQSQNLKDHVKLGRLVELKNNFKPERV